MVIETTLVGGMGSDRSGRARVPLSKQNACNQFPTRGTKMKKLAVAVFALAFGLSLSAFSQDTSSQPSDKQQGSSAQTSDQQGSTSSPSEGSASQGSMPQDQTTSGMDQPSDKKAGKAKLKHLKGTIGQDGKSFTSDKDNKTWSIMNPEAVKGHEGHHVRLEAHVYPDKEAVHVMDVKMMGEKTSESKGSDKSDNKPMSEQPPK
jgi:hypothetical protein